MDDAWVVVVDVAAVDPGAQHVFGEASAGGGNGGAELRKERVHLSAAVAFGEARGAGDAHVGVGCVGEAPRFEGDPAAGGGGLIDDRGGASGEEFPQAGALIGGVAQMEAQQQFVVVGDPAFGALRPIRLPERVEFGGEVGERPGDRLGGAEKFAAARRLTGGEIAPYDLYFSGHFCTRSRTAGSVMRSVARLFCFLGLLYL